MGCCHRPRHARLRCPREAHVENKGRHQQQALPKESQSKKARVVASEVNSRNWNGLFWNVLVAQRPVGPNEKRQSCALLVWRVRGWRISCFGRHHLVDLSPYIYPKSPAPQPYRVLYSLSRCTVSENVLDLRSGTHNVLSRKLQPTT